MDNTPIQTNKFTKEERVFIVRQYYKTNSYKKTINLQIEGLQANLRFSSLFKNLKTQLHSSIKRIQVVLEER